MVPIDVSLSLVSIVDDGNDDEEEDENVVTTSVIVERILDG